MTGPLHRLLWEVERFLIVHFLEDIFEFLFSPFLCLVDRVQYPNAKENQKRYQFDEFIHYYVSEPLSSSVDSSSSDWPIESRILVSA